MIDFKAYLSQKKDRQIRAKQDLQSLRQYCYRCYRPAQHCLCSQAKPFQTKTSFVILMHPREARKERNGTGRLARLCLERSRIQFGIDFSDDPEVNRLIQDPYHHPFLLYPGAKARELREFPFSELEQKRKRPLLVLIDGTWTGAKKMMKLSRNLHGLPRFAVHSSQPSRFLIKRQPHRICLSTIESIFYYLEEADKAGFEDLKGQHHVLMEILKEMVTFQLERTMSADGEGYRRNTSAPLKDQRILQRKNPRRTFFD